MVNEDDFSCISDIGAIMQLLGGVVILSSQVINIVNYLSVLQILPSLSPSELPGVEFYLYIFRIIIGVSVLFGGLCILAGFIAIWKSGPIGGFLAIFFAIPTFWFISLIFYPGPVLAIFGGILSIAPSVRRPKTKRKRSNK